MLDIYSFVKDMINCENTLRKIEVFQKWKLSDCKVYLFDENISNFKGEGFKESNYGKFYLIGLGDYEKTWVIDKNTVKNKSIEIKANKVVNYDLNIFTYIHNHWYNRTIPDKENFIRFISYIKESGFTNNITTALLERYSNFVNKEILGKMIESYVYFDNIELKDFITSRRSMLSFEQYEWMREILDGADHLNNMEEIQSYDCIVCYVLKAFILKNTKDISIENKIKEFKEYCLSTLNVYMELEFFLLVRYLENDNSVQKIFEKLQIGAKKIVDRLYNVVWDIFHIRLVEQSFLNDCIKDKDVVHLHYFATADLGLSEVIKANPIKMIVYYNENMITIRKYNLSDIISSTERDKFFNKDAIKNRSIKVKKINFTDIKENLIKELEQLIK